MKVPLLDLQAQFRTIEQPLRQAIDEVLTTQRFILGPPVEGLEREIADYVGARHAIGVSSGTDALLCSLMAAGIGSGDEVITSTFTFFATAGSIARTGARPVFVDIRPDTYNLDPAAVERAITPRTRAIIPVHLFGQCADMDPIMELARRHDLLVVEDAAQSIGARHHGRAAGTMGHLGCFSFFPSKNLGGFGDGGMIVTNDDDLADRCRLLRVHGSRPKYWHHVIGGNFRLDALQAAVLRVKLRYLDGWHEARRRHAALYDSLFAGSGVGTPVVADGNISVFNQYVIRVAQRDSLREWLASRGVGSEVYYPVPLHLQPCFAALGGREGDCPVAEAAAREVLALPVYPELTDEQIRYVASCVLEHQQRSGAGSGGRQGTASATQRAD